MSGFLQIWHSSFAKDYNKKSKTAASDDVRFEKRFEKIIELPFKVEDVSGELGVHWNGRKL